MRSLNEFEKEVVKYMVLKDKPEQELFIYNLLYRFCGAYYIEWNEEMTEIIVMYSVEQNWEQVRQKLFDFIILIQYLDEEKYIGIFFDVNIGLSSYFIIPSIVLLSAVITTIVLSLNLLFLNLSKKVPTLSKA